MMVRPKMRRKSGRWEPWTFVASLLLISSALILASVSGASATSYTISVGTNSPSYSGSEAILVTGFVSPAPGGGTSVVIDVSNPSGTLVHTDSVTVDGNTGSFSDGFVAGGANWINGAYTVEATWAPSISGTPIFATTTFTYATTASTSTATTTITITTTLTQTITTTIGLATYTTTVSLPTTITSTVVQPIVITWTTTLPTTITSTVVQTTTSTTTGLTSTLTTTLPTTTTTTVTQHTATSTTTVTRPTTITSTAARPTTITRTRTLNQTITLATTQVGTASQPTTTTTTIITAIFSITTTSAISNFSTYVILGAAVIAVLAVAAWVVLRGRGRREYWRVRR